MISGHTHRAYLCVIDGRLVTSADKFGTLVTAIDLKLDPVTRDVVAVHAENHIVRTSLAKEPEQTALIESYEKVAAPIANRRAGTDHRDTVARAEPDRRKRARRCRGGRAACGDAQRGQDGGAVMAFTNPGGVRTDIPRKEDGTVTYADRVRQPAVPQSAWSR